VSLLRAEHFSKAYAFARNHFLAGLLVVVPLGAIAWIVLLALRALWGLQGWMPEAWRPENWLPSRVLAYAVSLAILVATTLVLVALVAATGWVSKQLAGKQILDFISTHVIARIPVLRSIHKALDQLLRTMTSGGGQQFHRVVYVEYPRKGLWVLAFVTGPVVDPSFEPGHLNIFVPTTPNPTSGFHLNVAESEVRESAMSVEEAFRTILSLGIVGRDSPSGTKHEVAKLAG
jgi:uncharacterized membrane protein